MSSFVQQFSPPSLRALRTKRGLSRTDLAARIGVMYETLVAWEAGRQDPRADSLAALSAVLGCSVDALFASPSENDPAGRPGHSTTASGRTHGSA